MSKNDNNIPPKNNELVIATIAALNKLSMEDHSDAPKIGQEVYVDSSLYLTHGVDDFMGGLCKISSVHFIGNTYEIAVAEDPDVYSSWTELEKEQGALKKKFGIKRGHKRPDNRNEFNT